MCNINRRFVEFEDSDLLENEEFCLFLDDYSISKEQYIKVKREIKQTSIDLKPSNLSGKEKLEENICLICKQGINSQFAEQFIKHFYDIDFCTNVFNVFYSHFLKYQIKD